MKTLDLYAMPGILAGRAYLARVPMSDKEFIEREIKKWLTSFERESQIIGEVYYDNHHDIESKKRTAIGQDGSLTEVKNLPNNKIIDNQYAKMVDQKSNYLLGKPITFDAKNSAYAKALTGYFTKQMHRKLKSLAEESIIGGKAWAFPYYTDENVFSFSVFPAYEVLPFWRDSEHTELDCAVHYYKVYAYDDDRRDTVIDKVELIHGGGVDRFIYKDGSLIPDPDAESGSHVTVTRDGKAEGQNWERIPLICFKANHREIPLICRVKCLQDALNAVMSSFADNSEEDVRNTILVIKNYDGEDLGKFRQNLATYGAVKVKSIDGVEGGVDTLKIEVNVENYKVIIEILKKAIIENARGYDAKDERMAGNPNQMNIQSMYSDIDLDANGMETEYQAAMEEMIWFLDRHFANTGVGNFDGEDVNVIFNRDILINETEVIDNCSKSSGIISDETIIKNHPWIDDPEEELERLKKEKEEALTDGLEGAFLNGSEPSGAAAGNVDE